MRYFTGKSVARVDKGRSRRTQPLPLRPNILDFNGNAAGKGGDGMDYFWLGVYICWYNTPYAAKYEPQGSRYKVSIVLCKLYFPKIVKTVSEFCIHTKKNNLARKLLLQYLLACG